MDFAEIVSATASPAPERRSPLMLFDVKWFTQDVNNATCASMQHDDVYTQDEMQSASLIAVFAIMSILFTSAVALMMRSNKRLMAHPNSLIFYMCLCEGIIAWQAMVSHIGVSTFICYFQLDEVF